MKNQKIIRSFNIRLPYEMWVFLKKQSIDQEKTMNAIIQNALEELKRKYEKKVAIK